MAESTESGAKLQATLEDDDEVEEHDQDETGAAGEAAGGESSGQKKKKKSKRQKIAAALTGNKGPSDEAIQTLLDMNPAMKQELQDMPEDKKKEAIKNLDVSKLLTGLSLNQKNVKDMGAYRFWQTQPVPRLDEKPEASQPDGPIKEVDPQRVPKEPSALPAGYEWVELDLTNDAEVKEVYTLLTHHYVEDDSAMFRFNYSQSFLNWALKAPGWRQSWHVGVRAQGPSRLLVASVFGIPTKLRVRQNVIDVVEINFLCIHKKLRGKRLAPVLIKEVTRRTHLMGIYQAVYTAGVVLPTPVASCRYFHRSLDWLKLYEVGFSPLPPNSTKTRMITRNQLPAHTSTSGWRDMKESDIDAVLDLLSRYLKRFQLAQELTKEEMKHWFVNRQENDDDRVVWSFVVEQEGKITDFASFYCLESSVIGKQSEKHPKIRAAYLFYYATEMAFVEKENRLKERLQGLVQDLLIEAKKAKFDVFNALTLHDNPMFLEHLKFGAGDGQLHFYLYNWRTPPVTGGVDKHNQPDEKMRGGVGLVML